MKISSAILALALALPAGAWAQTQLTIQDDFTLGTAQNNWKTYDGACLTAGTGGSIPPCVGLPYYAGQTLVGGTSGTLPDTVGNGALRFTNGPTNGQPNDFQHGFSQAGGIISNFTFNAGTGVNVIFKTVTYRGDSGGAGGDGADGMSFFLTDGAYAPYDMGAFGGSLGYSCSNRNNDGTLRADGTPRQFDGLPHAYLGLGIDEFGNFLNGSGLMPGYIGTNLATGDNTALGYGYKPGRIGLRGAGSITWGALNNGPATSIYYPTSLSVANRANAVQNTCITGTIWDYRNANSPTDTGIALADYAPIPNAYKELSGVQIANEAALTRSGAVPIAYQLKITQDGLLSFSYSYNGGAYQPVITKQNITSGNGPLPSTLRFGFAGSTGGSTNIHEILCFQASPSDLAATSVGVNEKEATKIASGTQAFLAFYFPNNWTGSLTANDLLFNAVTNQVTVNATANWDASCNLTGVSSPATCASTGATSVTAQSPASRTILTWNGATGIPFEWNKLTAAQQNALDLGDGSATAKRLNYLRGDRTNEINSAGAGLYRARDSVLGDIVDSSPSWVGPPIDPYSLTWSDHLYPAQSPAENGANSYKAFTTAQQTRTNVVYAGANDGLLHGFRAGSFDVTNTYVSTNNDGQEVLAYMPAAVLQAIHQSGGGNAATLDYSNTQYAHSFYVDATPATDDLFYSGAWHTWLVGGLGAGGSALYALDVTSPATFSEANAATTVIGEWTPASLTCVHSVNLIGASTCANSLGNTYGVPVIRRLHNGNWAVIFGNGYGSATGDAGIFVMVVSAAGTQSFYYIGTGVTGKPAGQQGINGIASPAPADLDGDHITDYVYAGDLLGNLWRFDLTNSNPNLWTVGATPLFTDPAGHPITTKIMTVSTNMPSGPPRIMLSFGTGRKIPLTNSTPQSYVGGTHELYGIWDWNVTNWNSKSMTQYASLASIPSAISLATLQQQTLTTNAVTGALDDTTNPVCWAQSTPTCTTSPQYGWYITLPGASEQVVFNPLVYLNALIVNTTIPANNSLLSCKTLTDTGNTIGISVSTGGAIPGFFPYFNDTSAVGGQTNGSGSPFIVLAGGQAQILTQTIGNLPAGSGAGATGPFGCNGPLCSATAKPKGPTGKRLTWTERR